MTVKKSVQLAQLVNTTSPEAVLEEVKYNFIQFYSISDFLIVREMFNRYLEFFANIPEYDMNLSLPHREVGHGIDTMLAFSRIVDGYNIKNKPVSVDKVKIGLITAFFHNIWGMEVTPVQSKIRTATDFIYGIFSEIGFSKASQTLAAKMIECTDFEARPSEISFKDNNERTLSFMVGTANIIGQMASRLYLEKLFFLYDKVKEAKIINTSSIAFILKKTVDFYQNRAKDRLEKDFQGLHKLYKVHFNKRYKINRNLYIEAIEKQLDYLETILKKYPRSYGKKLRRK